MSWAGQGSKQKEEVYDESRCHCCRSGPGGDYRRCVYPAQPEKCECAQATVPFAQLKEELEEGGSARGLDIHVQREDIFHAMHRI